MTPSVITGVLSALFFGGSIFFTSVGGGTITFFTSVGGGTITFFTSTGGVSVSLVFSSPFDISDWFVLSIVLPFNCPSNFSLYDLKALKIAEAIRSCPSGLDKNLSSSGFEINPNSIKVAGIAVL